jgi:hypothetical protein
MSECEKCIFADDIAAMHETLGKHDEAIKRLTNSEQRHDDSIGDLFDRVHGSDKAIGIIAQKLDSLATATANSFGEIKETTAANFKELKTMITDFISLQDKQKEKQSDDVKDNKKQWKWAIVALIGSVIGGVAVAIVTNYL